MENVAIILLAFLGFYIVYFVFIIKGIVSGEKIEITKDFIPGHFISVVVAVRNEEHTIANLVDDLKKQTFPDALFEVIIVNEHSTDNTANVVKETIKNSSNFNYFELAENEGKKAALLFGYKKAKGEFILSTDADCRMNENWISAHAFTAHHSNADLILGPVKYKNGKGFLHQFQTLEQLALQAVTIGSVGLKNAVLSNGANMMFRKAILEKINDPLYQKFASGDDIFLLQNVKRDKQLKVAFAKCKEAMVETKAAATLKEMLVQHIRWFSKTKGYKDFSMILSAGIIGLANISLSGLFVLCLLNINFLRFFALGLLLKAFVDMLLIFLITEVYDRKPAFLTFLIHELIYGFFSITVFFLSFFVRPKWKGRKI